jgi:hypothetical protein
MRNRFVITVINDLPICLQFEMNWKPVWMNQSPVWRDQRPGKKPRLRMINFFQWIGLALGSALVVFGVFGFFRGLSLPPNTPEHRAHGKGDSWRI